MNRSCLSIVATVVVPVATALLSMTPVLRAAQSPESTPAHAVPMPQNLKVLPKDLSVHQVREIMEDWTDATGADCSTCHVRNPKDIGPNGRPRFNYADDTKQEKRTARVMYAMTESINSDFVAKVPNSGVPVSCGTCHRGHLSPVPYDSSASSPAVPQGAQPGK